MKNNSINKNRIIYTIIYMMRKVTGCGCYPTKKKRKKEMKDTHCGPKTTILTEFPE